MKRQTFKKRDRPWLVFDVGFLKSGLSFVTKQVFVPWC